MLELRTLTKHFGGVRAVDGLDITVEQGQIFGLIGPNGSGKSTTVNLVCGVFPVTAGSVRFEGTEITNSPPHVALRSGIARTFQNIRLFSDLTVWQNLWVAQNGQESVRSEGFFSRWLAGTRGQRASVEEQLEFSGLGDKRDELAGSLAFGEQRRLELARALAARPKLLLLDEPAAGMNLEEVKQLDERFAVAQRAAGHHHPPRRARHGARDGDNPPDRGSQLRAQDRRGVAGRNPAEPSRAGSLSRPIGRRRRRR